MLSRTYKWLEGIHNTKYFLLAYRIIKIYLNVWYPIRFRFTRRNRKFREECDVIVSLTSFPARINRLYLVIYSLINQTIKPLKIILYLSKEQFGGLDDLPKTLMELYHNSILDICFVDGDIRSHKKYYYSFRDYPDNRIIIVDDDFIYPENLVEVLLNMGDKYPKSVCCIHGHKIRMEKEVILPYLKWERDTQCLDKENRRIVPGGGGGVLYPPHCFDGTDVLKINKIMDICPLADDLWLKCHSLLNGYLTVKSSVYPYWVFCDVIYKKNVSLKTENLDKNMNDIQMQRLVKEYPGFLTNLIDNN